MEMQVQWTVSPDRLVKAAEEWRTYTGAVETEMGKMAEVIRQTRGYWRGRGGDGCRSQMALCLEEASGAVRPLKNKYETLLQIAGIYESSESKNKEMAGTLGTDILK